MAITYVNSDFDLFLAKTGRKLPPQIFLYISGCSMLTYEQFRYVNIGDTYPHDEHLFQAGLFSYLVYFRHDAFFS